MPGTFSTGTGCEALSSPPTLHSLSPRSWPAACLQSRRLSRGFRCRFRNGHRLSLRCRNIIVVCLRSFLRVDFLCHNSRMKMGNGALPPLPGWILRMKKGVLFALLVGGMDHDLRRADDVHVHFHAHLEKNSSELACRRSISGCPCRSRNPPPSTGWSPCRWRTRRAPSCVRGFPRPGRCACP